MRLKHVNVRVLLSSLLAVLALSAVAASAAQASVEGPFFKDGATRLLEGESKEVKVKNASQTFRMSVSTLGIGLGCGKVGVASGAKLLGSTGANSATGEATLEFSECRWEGSQAQCKITGEAFKTKLLKLELAYPGDARSGDIEVLLKPAKGSEFADVKSTGECFWPEMNIEGSTIAESKPMTSPLPWAANRRRPRRCNSGSSPAKQGKHGPKKAARWRARNGNWMPVGPRSPSWVDWKPNWPAARTGACSADPAVRRVK